MHHELPSLFFIVVDKILVKLHRQEFGHRNLRRQFKKMYILAVSVKIVHTTLIEALSDKTFSCFVFFKSSDSTGFMFLI